MFTINELQLAKELIKFPTVTPVDAGIMKFLKNKIKKLGFKTKILEFKENKLQSLPESLSNCVELKKIKLSNNQLTEVLDVLANLPQIENISIYGNQISVEAKKRLKAALPKAHIN